MTLHAGPALRGERAAVLAILALLTLAGWAWLSYHDWAMRHMEMVAMAMPSAAAWNVGDLLLVFAMWAVMMAAMMVPAATPVIMLYARISSARNPRTRALLCSAAFLAGYLVAWTGFSVLATLLQWGLHALALTTPLMTATPVLGALLLVAAGIYQWSPLKLACLAQCRAPLGFLMNRWRPGASGAAVMGAAHGAYCIGCCWMLMLLMFVLGMMNLYWTVALALIVLLEKTAAHGDTIGRAAGTLFVLWGGLLLLLLQSAGS